MNTGGWAKVPGPARDVKRPRGEARLDYSHGLGTTVPSQPLVEPDGDHSALRRPLPPQHLNLDEAFDFLSFF